MRFLSLAWRNLRRNQRRTLLTVLVFAIGVIALIFAWSIFDGSNKQMIGNMTGNYKGHIQAHRRGYSDNPNIDSAFNLTDVLKSKISSLPGIANVTIRLEASVLLNSQDNARGILLVGVDPKLEPEVTVLHKTLSEGRYFNPAEQGGILIGKPLAKVLNVTIGSEVSVVTQGMQGAIGAMRYHVQGIYDTQNEIVDGMQAFVTLPDAKELLSAGENITSVVFKLQDLAYVESVAKDLSSLLGNTFEVETWEALLPAVAQSVRFHENLGNIFTLILFSIVAIGVMNSVIMSVTERRREFGVMMAIGTSPSQIFRTILYEGWLLSLIGLFMGFLIGCPIVAYLGRSGIEFSAQAQAVQTMQGVSSSIYPYLSVQRMANIGFVVFIITTISTLYPAWRIARLLPLQALQKSMYGNGNGIQVSGIPMRIRFLLLTLALRNIRRYPLRSSLTLFGAIVGLGGFIFIGSIANGYFDQMVTNITGMMTGDAQIQHKNFKVDMRPELSIPGGMFLVDRLRKETPALGVSPRVQTTAVINSTTQFQPIILIGVNPEDERHVSFLDRAVKVGQFLKKDLNKEIVIGRKLAKLLNVRIGERVVLMSQDVHGELVSEAFFVSGFFDTNGDTFDRGVAYINLPAAQKMLGMGESITNIVLKATSLTFVGDLIKQTTKILTINDIRVIPWQELLPEVAQLSSIAKHALAVVLIIVLVVISIVVMNTVLMSVLERTREFGTMLALGSSPGLIVRLVLLESTILGIIGALLGILFGTLITLLHQKHGVDIKLHGGTAVPGITDVIFPQLSAPILLIPALLLIIFAFVAALYPALHASRLKPIIAIRNG